MMRRLTTLMVAMGLAAGSAAAVAADLPNYDASIAVLRAKANNQAPTTKQVRQATAGTESGWQNVSDTLLGHDTFVWAPSANAPQPVEAFKPGFGAQVNARQYLLAEGGKLGVSQLQADSAKLVHLHDLKRGAVIAKFQQQVGSLQVFGRQVNVMMDQNNHFVAASGYFAPADSISGDFSISPETAIVDAFGNMGGRLSLANLQAGVDMAGGYSTFHQVSPQGYAIQHPVRLKRVLFPLGSQLVPAYYLELQAGNAGSSDTDAYSYVVDARNGKILFRHNLISQATFSYRVWADSSTKEPMDSPLGDWLSPSTLSSPSASVTRPGVQAANLITLDHGPISKSDPWLPAGATTPEGNNADAYTDTSGGDGYNPSEGDLQPTTTSAGVFDYAYNDSNGPSNTNNRKATVIQAFYLVNWLHDFWYDRGFNEASGNGQIDNLGRGGLANDPVHVEVQDHSGRNNANMLAVTDGAAPRMQMYLFDGPFDRTLDESSPSTRSFTTLGGAAFGTHASGDFDLTADVVLMNDGTGTTSDGCEAATNAGAISGKIALIDRGTCAFTTKVRNAQDAGATGVLIANNDGGTTVISMGADPADDTSDITVPILMVTQNDGATLKGDLASTTTVTMHQAYTGDRDGALDASIVAHEFFHFVSTRLVDNGNGLINQQGGAMGEGWSDFSSLMLVTHASDLSVSGNDQLQAAYPVGEYVMSVPYYGIRRAPYSTDMTINPLTFKDIQNGVPLPTTAPLAFGQDGSFNAEVHSAGEIWTLCLWEGFAQLVNDSRYTFDQAKTRMMDYVIAGLKMTPPSPTYIEARNGILAAALARDAGDFDDLATGFARRGMGWGAVGPDRDSTDLTGVTESYQDKQSGQAPQVVISAPSSATSPTRVKLDSTGTADPDGGTVALKWKVVSGDAELLENDQQVVTLKLPLGSSGAVKVRLTATDFENKSTSKDVTINVTKGADPISGVNSGGGAFGIVTLFMLLGLTLVGRGIGRRR